MQKQQEKDTIRQVDIALIDEPDGWVRLEIDQEDIKSLADNIREVGQIQPINLAIKGKRFEIIAGHLRYLAIKELGRKKINAIVKKVPKREIALIRASENLKRKNLSPIEEGAVYADLVDEYGMTKMGIAEKFGIAASTVLNKMELLRLNPEIQKLIHKGLIYINVGQELNKIDNERELKKSLNDAVNNGCSIETARVWVEDYKRSLTYEPSNESGGGPVQEQISPQKIYQACELCENPIEIQEMKIIRICPGCYKIIADNLKGGGA